MDKELGIRLPGTPKKVKFFYSRDARDAYEAGCLSVERRKAAAWFRVSRKLEEAYIVKHMVETACQGEILWESSVENNWEDG